MEEPAAPQRSSLSSGLRAGSLLILGAAFALAVCFGGTALAKRHQLVGRDGKIHACYRVKGKPRGMVRVVRGSRHRCRRGERRMAWAIATVTGAPGSPGATGAQGDPGAAGTAGTSADDAALKAQIGELTLKVDALEGVLAGITNEELTEAVNVLPSVESLCAQSEELTEQVNLLAGAVEGLGLNGILTGLGGLLEIPPLPTALEPFSC